MPPARVFLSGWQGSSAQFCACSDDGRIHLGSAECPSVTGCHAPLYAISGAWEHVPMSPEGVASALEIVFYSYCLTINYGSRARLRVRVKRRGSCNAQRSHSTQRLCSRDLSQVTFFIPDWLAALGQAFWVIVPLRRSDSGTLFSSWASRVSWTDGPLANTCRSSLISSTKEHGVRSICPPPGQNETTSPE